MTRRSITHWAFMLLTFTVPAYAVHKQVNIWEGDKLKSRFSAYKVPIDQAIYKLPKLEGANLYSRNLVQLQWMEVKCKDAKFQINGYDSVIRQHLLNNPEYANSFTANQFENNEDDR